MRKTAILLLLCMMCGSAFAAPIGERADSAYNKENYRLAIELYEQSIADEGVSATAYYNLGNAYFRNDNLGKAVLSYERALKLDPTDGDARQNLKFVLSRIQDRPEDDSSFFAGVHRSVVSWQHPDVWAWIAFAVFVLFAGAVSCYLFSPNIMVKKAGFFGGFILLLLFIYALVIAADSAATAQRRSDAVVVAPSTQLSSTPRASRTASDKIVTIHEGTKVSIIDSVATPDDPVSPMWYNVKLNNSTKAWLRATDVERI